MLFANIEFFAHETEVWYRTADSAFKRLEESDRDLIDVLLSHIKTFYPTAYEALSKEYERCAPNRRYTPIVWRCALSAAISRNLTMSRTYLPDVSSISNTSNVRSVANVSTKTQSVVHPSTRICRQANCVSSATGTTD